MKTNTCIRCNEVFVSEKTELYCIKCLPPGWSEHWAYCRKCGRGVRRDAHQCVFCREQLPTTDSSVSSRV